MRDMKCRALTDAKLISITGVETRREVKGYYCQVEDKHYIILDDAEYCPLAGYGEFIKGFVEVDPETVRQFIGKLDKDRIEIYEYDIVSYSHPELSKPVYFEVVYYDGGFSQRRLDIKREDMPADHCDNIWYYWEHLKIIGNTTENPKLLEEQNDQVI